MVNHKIIFSGPVGAGKTTAITSLSDIPPVRTDEMSSDMTTMCKRETTVALDYGVMKLDSGERIHLYGTPGQERFDFMWDILTEGGIGLILLVNNARPDPLKDLHFFLKSFHQFISANMVAIGITHTDISASPTMNDYHQKLATTHPRIPIFEVDAREREELTLLMEAFFCSMDPGLTDNG